MTALVVALTVLITLGIWTGELLRILGQVIKIVAGVVLLVFLAVWAARSVHVRQAERVTRPT